MAKAYRRPKPSLPLDLPGDSDAVRQAIAALQARRIRPHRPSRPQIKVGDYSYYPDRQTLLKDGGTSKRATLATFLEAVSGAEASSDEPRSVINLREFSNT
jgi:hypothetical protein